MWYDSFLSQIYDFIDVFDGGEIFWGDIINGATISILLVVLFTISAAIAMIVNGVCCGELKLAKCMRKIKAFTARFGVIQKGNFIHFNKLCVRAMPVSCRRTCIRYIFNPTTENQVNFKRSLQKVSDRSCTNAFIAYICVFGIGAITAIATIALETFYLEANNLWVAISLFYGAIFLIAMALQMYFLGNKYKNIDVQIYSEVVSRYVKEEKFDKINQKVQNKADNKAFDSIDELRRIVYGLIESGASKELLELFKNGLLSVASTNYNSTADQLRLENIVTKINNYIA